MLAVSTGMRLGEILGIRRSHIDIEKQRLILEDTKNGDRRAVALAGPALAEITSRLGVDGPKDSMLFPGRLPTQPQLAVKRAWKTALKKTGITDFRFHDLRHCAASLLLESGASVAELAEILGHRTLQMVKRYAHLSESQSAKRVAQMNAALFEAA